MRPTAMPVEVEGKGTGSSARPGHSSVTSEESWAKFPRRRSCRAGMARPAAPRSERGTIAEKCSSLVVGECTRLPINGQDNMRRGAERGEKQGHGGPVGERMQRGLEIGDPLVQEPVEPG